MHRGETAFIIDGSIPNQVCRMVEIKQIVDDTAILKCIPGGGIALRLTSDLFTSAYDCNEAIKNGIRTKADAYASEIENIDSLVRFMLTHDIDVKTSDKLARATVIKRAKELGIDLQDIAE